MNNEKLTTENRSTELVIDRFPIVRCPSCILHPASFDTASRSIRGLRASVRLAKSRAETPGSMR